MENFTVLTISAIVAIIFIPSVIFLYNLFNKKELARQLIIAPDKKLRCRKCGKFMVGKFPIPTPCPKGGTHEWVQVRNPVDDAITY